MENNKQLLKYDENIGLYDHIDPILNLKDLNRKQVKGLAKEIANNESQTHSWQEVLNDAINYDSKNKKQEKRFKRIFNKQLNENLTPILEKQHKQELIDRMKSGDASAMSQWTTEGIDKFGHQFMPVMLTAATLPFGISAFGQAANTMGLLPALGAEAGSWGLGYGGYKLGSKLDDDFGTNWIAPTLSVASGVGGYGAGYKGMVKLGSKRWLPKGDKFMYGSQFVGDVAADALTRQTKIIPKQKKFNTLMDLSRSDEFVQQNLFQDPTDVKTIIHGDGAASGFNDPKKLTTVGHRELTSLKQLPHFEEGRIVPANTEISQPGGRTISAKEHPLFLSDTQPWYETAHNGETLKRYWGIDGKNSTGLWEWIDKKGKMHIPTESPYRFITANIDDLPDTKPGQFTGRRGSSEYESLEGIPLSKIKSAFEYDPVLKTWKRVQYVDSSKPTSKGAYTWFERPSKLTEAERLGIPKGERNNGKILLSMQDLVPQKFVSVPGFKPIGGKLTADAVAKHPHILDRTTRLQSAYRRFIDPEYKPKQSWRKTRTDTPQMAIVDDIGNFVDVTNTNSPTSEIKQVGGFYSPLEDKIYIDANKGRTSKDAQASIAFHEELHGHNFGQDEINDWIIKHLIDPEKVRGISPQAQKYYLGSQEAPVHALQHGFVKGLDIGAPYPGDEAFDELLNSGYGGSLHYFKTQSPKDKRRLWRAMTGDLFVKKQGGKIENPDQ